MIFLVNRVGEISAIGADFVAELTDEGYGQLLRACAWCTNWLTAAQIAAKRRQAMQRIGLK